MTSLTDLLGKNVAENEIELGQEVFHEVRRAVFAAGGRRARNDGRYMYDRRPRRALRKAFTHCPHHLIQLLL